MITRGQYLVFFAKTLDGMSGIVAELGAGAHQICPYSKATRGNVEVTIDATVD